VRPVTRDTWNLFLRFTVDISEDLDKYSEDDCWPLLFDHFVEQQRDEQRRRKDDVSNKTSKTREDEGEGLTTLVCSLHLGSASSRLIHSNTVI